MSKQNANSRPLNGDQWLTTNHSKQSIQHNPAYP
jgi:hypothetical protein